MRPRVYLAGPDVFHRDAVRLGTEKKRLCADYGFEGLYPLDHTIAPETPDMSRAIYEACVAMMAEADCGIFNLTPFRGPSADVGTVLELGMMATAGRPVFAYTNVAADLIDRLRDAPGLKQDAAGLWRDPIGMLAEDFGNVDNLMLDESLATQGRKIHRRSVGTTGRFEDLHGFASCLREAARFYKLA